jgi:hypothetical protein
MIMKNTPSQFPASASSRPAGFPRLSHRPLSRTLSLFGTVAIVALLTGCQTRVTSGIACTEERVAFIQPGVTHRDEVSRQLGYNGLNRPKWEWMQGRTIAYVWQTTNGATAGHNLVLFPSKVTWVQQTDHAYCITFDDQDRVARTAFLEASDPEKLSAAIERWLDLPPATGTRDLRLTSAAPLPR